MKTYQFVTFAIVGLALVAIIFMKGRKKPCGCKEPVLETTTEGE